MTINPFELDKLFSANYRSKQIRENGFTDAEYLMIDDLNFQAFRPDERKGGSN